VKKWGFPGPTSRSHQICYRFLKERALRKFVTYECKTAPKKRENVLLLTGIRKQESRIRMGYIDEAQKEGSRVWSNPIFWWSTEKCEQYMDKHQLPRNPVKDKICISGECLCGAFADHGEYMEIKESYPHVAQRIDELHEMAKENGHPWHWSSGPTEWYKNNPPGQLNMFMCVGCETKREEQDD
jgi:3'-phosphoadenosine 5'-phosphosulfate sulfotransferase (PAPS reductase)/FAD synthetase